MNRPLDSVSVSFQGHLLPTIFIQLFVFVQEENSFFKKVRSKLELIIPLKKVMVTQLDNTGDAGTLHLMKRAYLAVVPTWFFFPPS